MADNKNQGLSFSAESLSNEMNDLVAKTGKDLGINSGNTVASPTSQTFMSGFSSDAISKDPIDGLQQGIVQGVHNLNIPAVTPSSQPFTTGFSSENFSNDIKDAIGSTGMQFGNIDVPPAARPDSDGHFGSTIASGLGLSAENYTQKSQDILTSSQDRLASMVPAGFTTGLENIKLPTSSDIFGGSSESSGGMKFDMPDSLTSASAGTFINDRVGESQALATNTLNNVTAAATTAQKDLFGNISETATTAQKDLFGNVTEATTSAQKDLMSNVTEASTTAEKSLFGNLTAATTSAQNSLFGYTGGLLGQEAADKDAKEGAAEAMNVGQRGIVDAKEDAMGGQITVLRYTRQHILYLKYPHCQLLGRISIPISFFPSLR